MIHGVGAGKGSLPRKVDPKRWDTGYSAIDFSSIRKPKHDAIHTPDTQPATEAPAATPTRREEDLDQ